MAASSLYIFLQGIVGNIIGVIYVTIAARILSVDEIGVASVLAMITSLFITFGTLAIPAAAVRFIPESLGKGKPDVAKGIYKNVLRFGLLVSVLFSSLCFIASTIISMIIFGNSVYQPLVAILALDIFALLFSSFCNGILAGVRRFKEISLAKIALVSIRYATSIYLLLMGYGLMGAVAGWVIGDFVGLGLSFLFASISFRTVQRSKTIPFKQLLKYSVPLYVSGILGYFSATVDRYVVLLFSGLSTLGIYSIAMTTAGVIGIVSGSLGGPLLPQYSELYGQHRKEALKEASIRTSRYVFLILVPSAVGLATVAYPIIMWLYGSNYGSGWLPLAIVSIANALTCVVIVVNNLLLSLAASRTFLESKILAIVVGIPSLALLVAPFGGVGAALAKVLMVFLLLAYPAYILRKKFGLHFDLDAFKKAWVSSIGMAAVVVLIQFLLADPSMLPVYVLIGAFTYFLMLRLLRAINEQDVSVLSQLVPKRFRIVVDVFAKIYGVEKHI